MCHPFRVSVLESYIFLTVHKNKNHINKVYTGLGLGHLKLKINEALNGNS
jgi:hypothetical protein